ncbi:MAG: hypothetical protein PWQ09_1222 [Candidatus Cloacimonadota bacterium]|jgi:CDP-glycerol glycerophosphotransferase (TagB/SpsB family)|nr:hypothetical protein [Candidatus Cloacimonadota bacterium]
MNIYYFANQVYQLSFALPLFKKLGGIFLIKRPRKILSFKVRMINTNVDFQPKTFLNIPPVIKKRPSQMQDLQGIVVSQSNTKLNVDKKKCKTIFVGHGTGDKRYGGNAETLLTYDYIFLSGAKHLQKIKDDKVNIPADKLVKIGNTRFDDYVNNKIDREHEMKRLGIIDKTRPNILYAPTWRWGNGTFNKYVYKFAQELTKDFNLIIRPHHHDSKKIYKVKLWAMSKGIKNIYFSNPNNLRSSDTMNDFIVSDLMISDTSSIVYEYLITRKPIILIKNNCNILHNMPLEMDASKYVSIYDGTQNLVSLIKDNLKKQNNYDIMNKLLFNCFYFNDGHSADRAAEFIKNISV